MTAQQDTLNMKNNRVCQLILPNHLNSLLLAERVVESVCLQANTSSKEASAIVLAMSETLCNIIQYGYDSGVESEIVLDVSIVDKVLTIMINDDGVELPSAVVNQYREGQIELPSIDVPIEDLPDSGWGVNILMMTANEVRYSRTSQGNKLELEFIVK